MRQNVVGRWRVGEGLQVLLCFWLMSLQLECVMVFHESLLVPALTYDSVTMVLREKEKSRIWDAQMDNLRGFLGIRRMDKVLNARSFAELQGM